ncbi:hypothetical protein [Ureibacillus terrenus]|nr:hypothetical protein [Ureibacillus terrenus]MED3764929.1 hypothetical protein [Ureibacillus terrenus]
MPGTFDVPGVFVADGLTFFRRAGAELGALTRRNGADEDLTGL